MLPRKQTSTHNGVPSKGKAISAIRVTVPPLVVDQPHTTEDSGSSSLQGQPLVSNPYCGTMIRSVRCPPT